MGELVILCVEDEPEVRAALVRDLEPFAAVARVDAAADAADARAAIADLLADGDQLALVLADHRMPGGSGTDLLVAVHADPATARARTVLVTGQAGLGDTIRAVNEAGLDHYVAKPWSADALHAVVRRLLTDYVLEARIDPLRFMRYLDAERLLAAYRDHGDE